MYTLFLPFIWIEKAAVIFKYVLETRETGILYKQWTPQWARIYWKNGKRKVQGVPQSQTTALPRHQEEKETDKTKQVQIEQTYEKH